MQTSPRVHRRAHQQAGRRCLCHLYLAAEAVGQCPCPYPSLQPSLCLHLLQPPAPLLAPLAGVDRAVAAPLVEARLKAAAEAKAAAAAAARSCCRLDFRLSPQAWAASAVVAQMKSRTRVPAPAVVVPAPALVPAPTLVPATVPQPLAASIPAVVVAAAADFPAKLFAATRTAPHQAPQQAPQHVEATDC